MWAHGACACAGAVARLRRADLGQQRQSRSTQGSLRCVGLAQGERRSRLRRQSPSSTVEHEGSQVASCRTWVRSTKTGASGGARARVLCTRSARLRGALEQAAASEAAGTRANDAGMWRAEARGSERGRGGVAVPGAPARGWELRATSIPKLTRERGASAVCARLAAWPARL